MIELRFHREIYDGSAIERALGVYRPYGTLTLEEGAVHWIVRVAETPGDAEHAWTLARELANYALGATIEARTGKSPPTAGSSPEPAADPQATGAKT